MKKNLVIQQDIDNFCNAVDINYQVDFVKAYEQIGDSELYGGKHCGSDAEHRGSEFIAQKLREIGLENVELIPCETSRYQFNGATLTVVGEDRVIKPYGYVSPGTDEAGITGELVDGIKCRKEDFASVDVEGKLVLFAAMGTLEGANLTGQIEMAMNHGAKAAIIYAVEDVLSDETIRVQPPNVVCTIPVVGICGKDAKWLQEKMAAGNCQVKLKVDADFRPNDGTTYNVVGEIPGSISEERIIYTAHLDHYFRCLQDNISTCSTLLGIAKAKVDSGYKPNRTITFAFHGSHETGGMDTRYPYIYGSYKLTHVSKPEWTGKAIANINFEYTALHMKKLQASAYVGVNAIPINYFPYSPELIGGGFEEKNQYAPQTEYYMLSWSDCISYHSAGIPTICNDPISEQYYEGTGPYVGRDHSNHDNWEVFDEKILEDVSRFYGGMGIYLDSTPYLTLDFTEETDRIKNEISQDALDELGADSTAYFKAVADLDVCAKTVNSTIAQGNEAYIEALSGGLTDGEKKDWFDKARAENEKLLKAYKIMADELDRYNVYDFIGFGSTKYMGNVGMLSDAKIALEAGDIEKAFEALGVVDLAASSYYFDEEVVEHMCRQICDPSFINRRTWAAGRELNIFTYYDLVETFCRESEAGEGFEETIRLIDQAIATEAGFVAGEIEHETACLKEITEIIQ
ncbi:MAG: M28 family peptidase [Lentihominibacter sp.]|jgi:Iap family predicted aminopeptidase